jgi:PAS domain S-box/diguanylate cyclase (GGDEF) domain
MFASSPRTSAHPALPAHLEGLADGLIVFDCNFRVAACNDAALTLLRQPLPMIVGRHVGEIVHRLMEVDCVAQDELAGCIKVAIDQEVPTSHCLARERWSTHGLFDEMGTPTGGFLLHHSRRSVCEAVQQRNEIQRLRDFVESASDWFWETDAELRYTYFSDRYQEATGVAPETRLGRKRGDFRLEGDNNGDWPAHLADLENRRPFRDFEFAYLDVDDKRRVARVSGRPVFDRDGTFLGYRGVGRDITAEVTAEERIRFLAQHDSLTGLPNRIVLKDRLEQHLRRAKRYSEGLAVLCVDLDDFKLVNDTLGHSAGDAVLCEAARRMRSVTREMDTIARLGGDEFTVIQINTRRFDDAEALAARLIEALSKPFDVHGEQIHCSASIGISIYPDDGTAGDELMRHADLALYKAKSSGRDTYRFYTAEMDREVQERRLMEKELREALSGENFCVYYQPQIDIASGRPTGCEALVRWIHPEKGAISPNVFIQAAERSGLIVALDRWVVRQACRQAKAWKDAGLLHHRVAVNLSAVQLRRSDVVNDVLKALRETGLSPEDLEIEITESVLLIDIETATAILHAIDALGISLAVDDFGTGYSSLTYLKRFPVSKVKIDRSFVHSLLRNEDDKAIARAIVTLGHSLGLKVVAEGVEDKEQLACLRELGCDQAQGYLIGRPMPAADFEAWLASSARHFQDLSAEQSDISNEIPTGSLRRWLGHMII